MTALIITLVVPAGVVLLLAVIEALVAPIADRLVEWLDD